MQFFMRIPFPSCTAPSPDRELASSPDSIPGSSLIATRHHRRAGFSLLEVSMAMAIFSLVMVGVIQALTVSETYIAQDSSSTDLSTEAIGLQAQMGQDLDNAAWFQNPPIQVPSNNVANPMYSTPITYPNVGTGDQGLGTTPWGDQLDFVKLRVGEIPATASSTANSGLMQLPSQQEIVHFNFDDASPANQPVSFNYLSTPGVTPNAVTTMIINPAWTAGMSTAQFQWPVFDSAVAGLTYAQNYAFGTPGKSPRLYRYITRLSPVTGNGQLVRQYSNDPQTNYAAIPLYGPNLNNASGPIVPPPVGSTSGPGPWCDDAILTDDIKATADSRFPTYDGTPGVRFHTFLTNLGLSQYQISVTLLLVKISPTTQLATIVPFQRTFSMRSVTF